MTPPTVHVRMVVKYTEGKDGAKVPRATSVVVPPGTVVDGSGRRSLEPDRVYEVRSNEYIRALVRRGELQIVNPAAVAAPKSAAKPAAKE